MAPPHSKAKSQKTNTEPAERQASPVQWKPIPAETIAKADKTNPLPSILQGRSGSPPPTPIRPLRSLPFNNPPDEEGPALTRLAHPKLGQNVGINEQMPLHCRFDAVAPYVEYKRGDDLSEEKPFPEREVDAPADLTDSEGDGQGRKWMRYMPRIYTPQHAFECNLAPDTFMSWNKDELRTYKIGRQLRGSSRIVFKTYHIRAPYDRIIAQLVAEVDHGEAHDSHESRRRQEYAKRLLDLFAIEAKQYSGNKLDFYPKTLTPVLVRQLNGLHDASSRVVNAVVSLNKPPATSEQAIKFYLGKDPTSPSLIPHYRRRLLNLPIPRWHLAIVLGVAQLGDGPVYDRFYNDHYKIMDSLHKSGYPQRGPNAIPLLSQDEVAAILCEGLTVFFNAELNLVPALYKDLVDYYRDKSQQVTPTPLPIPPVIAQPAIDNKGSSEPRTTPNPEDVVFNTGDESSELTSLPTTSQSPSED